MRFHCSKFKKVLAVAAAAVAMAGCGGGGGRSAEVLPSPAGDKVSGLAAVGAPVTGAQVVLRCANGVTGQTTTDDEGRWALELSNPQFPCLATMSNSASHPGVTLRSIAQETGHVNITPLTELVLARAVKQTSSSLDEISGAALLELVSSLEAAQSDVIMILVAQGFPASNLAIFTGQFEATKGDSYDDLLEQISVSLADDGKTLDDLIEVVSEADPENVPPLPNTTILNVAALSAMPQLNKASLAIEDGALKMSLEAGSNPIGAFVGSGAGNKAVVQLAGLAGMKLRDFHSVTINLKGDAAGVTAPPVSPYVSLNLTIDLACSTAPISGTTLADLTARRRILSYDPYYHFIAPTQEPKPRLSSTEFVDMTIAPSTPGWRVSAGVPIGVAITPNYNGSETLEAFDYQSYPDACIVDGATGDAGMFRAQESTCTTGAALVDTDPALCATPYSGALLFVGSSSASQVSTWLVNEVRFFRRESLEGEPSEDEPTARTFRTFRFQ